MFLHLQMSELVKHLHVGICMIVFLFLFLYYLTVHPFFLSICINSEIAPQ